MADVFDVIIVGGGASGLTAALYAGRRGLSTVVLSQDIGGQASTTAEVENYPGVDPIDGLVLMTKFQRQAEAAGAAIHLEEVLKVARPDDLFTVTTTAQAYRGRSVILAFGLTHRHLNIPGEEKFSGHGVSYCATCDAPLFKGKTTVVVGGGNSAMDAALLLSKCCPAVSIVTVNKEFHGERILIERLAATPTITSYTQARPKAILGDQAVSGLMIEHEGQEKTLPADGIFVEIGYVVNPQLVKELVELDPRRQIVIDPQSNGTSVPGLFAAGDVTTIPQKQIVISAGEGAKAALSAHQYLQSIGQAAISGRVDWGVKTPLRHETSLTNSASSHAG